MKRGVSLSLEQANAHQVRHGFAPVIPGESRQPTIQQERSSGILRGRKRSMNKTEAEFARILEAMWSRGEIVSFVYEGLRLKYADGLYYKADFVVMNPDKSVTLIETKGGHIWDRDKVRFRACAAEWRDWFAFELWQKKAGQWSRIR